MNVPEYDVPLELTDEQRWLATLPLRVREDIAKTKNTQARVTEYKERMVKEGRILRTQVRKLNMGHGLNPNLIATLLGVSRSRVLEILGRK